jgi:hypothetical protein
VRIAAAKRERAKSKEERRRLSGLPSLPAAEQVLDRPLY